LEDHLAIKQTPLYQIIVNDIENLIKTNNFEYDNPICTEKSLCEKYRVSRITAKHAITKLENRGILYRKRGLGSFVTRPIIQNAPERIFAMVIPFSTTQGGIFRAVESANQIFSGLGHQLTIHIGRTKAAENIELLESLNNQNVDGIVYYPWGSDLPEEILTAFTQREKPVIILDKTNTHPEFHSVVCDNYRGGYLLTEHLLSYGHTRICYLSRFKPEELSSIGDRYRGYKDCLLSSGNDFSPRFVHWDAVGKGKEGYYMLQHLVNTLRMEDVTAILCENDEVAFNVHMCCQNLGFRIPEDMNITGFDNIEWATTGSAQITTIDQNFGLIGEAITAALLDVNHEPRNQTIPVQLIPRASTGKAGKNTNTV
jgi:DNA-binding LacI/PurR family transcriptional regulator